MAEPISITVGGNSHWGVAIVDNDLDGTDAEKHPETDDIAISNDVELQFKGSTVLDSGVEVGVRIEIEGEEGKDQGDETYMYVEGSFGEIRIGNDDPASYQMGATAPYATFFYGINTPNWTGAISSGGSISTLAGVDVGGAGEEHGDSASMMYFSPVLNGFQFGMSYAPEAGAEARSGTAKRDKDGDAYSVGARYDGAFGDAGVTISAGYTSQDVPMVAERYTYERRKVIVRDFDTGTTTNRYLRSADNLGDSGVSNAEGTNVAVYQRDEWKKPTLAMFMGNTGTRASRLEAAVDSFEAAEKDEDITVFMADFNGDDSAIPVYQYQEVDDNGSHVFHNKKHDAVPGQTVSDYSVGVVVSMSGVSVGGSYRNTDHDKKDVDDTVQYDVGISYGEGPWVVSANYGNKSQDDDGKGNKTDTDFARLMANYNLGPGINLAGVIGQDSTDSGDDTSFAGIAMGISF